LGSGFVWRLDAGDDGAPLVPARPDGSPRRRQIGPLGHHIPHITT
jgi:hypothetical protein